MSKSNAGRKTKYDPELIPKLVESYATDGYSEAQIAENLGIAVSTFCVWKNKYPELTEALKKGKEPANADLKMAMMKTATGYYVEEEQTVTVLDVETREPKSFRKTTTKKYIPPSATMQIFLAKNRMPEQFRDVSRYELVSDKAEPVDINIKVVDPKTGTSETLEN